MKMKEIGCPFCGQIQMIDVEHCVSYDEERLLAIQSCNCNDAKDSKARLERTKKATEKIEALFSESHKAAAEVMISAIPALLDGEMTKMTVDFGDGIVGGLSATPKGTIKVTCKASRKIEFEE